MISVRDLPAIKLIRTDTTLDLSHMAKRAGEEKREENSRVGGRNWVLLYAVVGGEGGL